MVIFLNVNRADSDHNHHTHLQPINPYQAIFPSGPFKMYPVSINPSSANFLISPVSQTLSVSIQSVKYLAFVLNFSHCKYFTSYEPQRKILIHK